MRTRWGRRKHCESRTSWDDPTSSLLTPRPNLNLTKPLSIDVKGEVVFFPLLLQLALVLSGSCLPGYKMGTQRNHIRTWLLWSTLW